VLVAAGASWAAAFVIFLAVYAPLLVAARPDERAPSATASTTNVPAVVHGHRP
jgi:hypothetical protein